MYECTFHTELYLGTRIPSSQHYLLTTKQIYRNKNRKKNIFAQLEQLYIGYIKQLGLPSIVDSP